MPGKIPEINFHLPKIKIPEAAQKENKQNHNLPSDTKVTSGTLTLAPVQNQSSATASGPISEKDKKQYISEVNEDGFNLRYLPEECTKDFDIVLAAVKQMGSVLSSADASLKNNREIVLAAIKQEPFAYNSASQEMQKDKEIILEVLSEWKHFSVLADPPEKENVIQLLKNLPLSLKSEHLKIIEDLIDLNISVSNFFFLNTHQMEEIIANRKNFQTDARPLALVVFPPHRSDPFICFGRNQIKTLMEQGYHVVYIEAGKDTNFYDVLKEFGQKQKISLLVIAGHGEPTKINLGAEETSRKNRPPFEETHYLDFSDKEEMLKLNLDQYLKEEAVIILESCSTGEGKEKGANMANFIKDVFPGKTIYAPEKPAGPASYEFDNKGKIVGVNYEDSETYVITNSHRP